MTCLETYLGLGLKNNAIKSISQILQFERKTAFKYREKGVNFTFAFGKLQIWTELNVRETVFDCIFTDTITKYVKSTFENNSGWDPEKRLRKFSVSSLKTRTLFISSLCEKLRFDQYDWRICWVKTDTHGNLCNWRNRWRRYFVYRVDFL